MAEVAVAPVVNEEEKLHSSTTGVMLFNRWSYDEVQVINRSSSSITHFYFTSDCSIRFCLAQYWFVLMKCIFMICLVECISWYDWLKCICHHYNPVLQNVRPFELECIFMAYFRNWCWVELICAAIKTTKSSSFWIIVLIFSLWINAVFRITRLTFCYVISSDAVGKLQIMLF